MVIYVVNLKDQLLVVLYTTKKSMLFELFPASSYNSIVSKLDLLDFISLFVLLQKSVYLACILLQKVESWFRYCLQLGQIRLRKMLSMGEQRCILQLWLTMWTL